MVRILGTKYMQIKYSVAEIPKRTSYLNINNNNIDLHLNIDPRTIFHLLLIELPIVDFAII